MVWRSTHPGAGLDGTIHGSNQGGVVNWKSARMAGDSPILTGTPSQEEIAQSQRAHLDRMIKKAEEKQRMRAERREAATRRQNVVEGDHILFVNRDGETIMGVLQTDHMNEGVPPRLVELGEIDGYMAPVFGAQELKEILLGLKPLNPPDPQAA
jgi:hypothetical protein